VLFEDEGNSDPRFVSGRQLGSLAAEAGVLHAYNSGTEYQGCSVYANRWDDTFTPPGQHSAASHLVNLRLDDIVYFLVRSRQNVFGQPAGHLEALRTLLEQDRALLRAGQAPARQNFVLSVNRHAARWHLHLPEGHKDDFARWIYATPNRCPGLRLAHETYRQLMSNYGDVPELGDFSDFAHVYAVPYCEAITLDRRMRHYCSVASRKLCRMGCDTDYRVRLHENLASVMRHQQVQDPRNVGVVQPNRIPHRLRKFAHTLRTHALLLVHSRCFRKSE
jgi:hypothetical protein